VSSGTNAGLRRGQGGGDRLKQCRLDEFYLAHKTIPRVNTAIVTSNTLCPQRAKSPSMSISGNNESIWRANKIARTIVDQSLQIVEFPIISNSRSITYLSNGYKVKRAFFITR
jgi:hypothetical protein